MQETGVWSLDWEASLEKGMATHSSILAWRIPWTEKSGELQPMGSQRVRHNWVTNTFTFSYNYWHSGCIYNSVQFSGSVMSDSLQPYWLQHARLPYPSPTPRTCSNSCPSSQWCHPTVSASVVPFSCLQSFPATGSFLMSQFFYIRWPKDWSFNISPSNEYSRLISFRMDWLDVLAVQGTLKSLLQHHNSTASILQPSAFFIVQLSHPYMSTGITIY